MIIVTLKIIKELTVAKVSDPLRYRPLSDDPTRMLRKRLLDTWSVDLDRQLITSEQSRVVVGIIQNKETGELTQSTSVVYKTITTTRC